MSIIELSKYSQSCAVLGSLKQNERLHTSWGRVSKYKAPDRFLKNAESLIAKVVHKIVTLIVKLIQAIERLICGQSTTSNIKKVENLTDKILNTLDEDLPESTSKESYIALRQLGYVQSSLKRAVDCGLEAFKITNGDKKEEKIQAVINKIIEKVLPNLREKIAELERRSFDTDCKVVERLIDQVCGADSVETDVIFSTAAVKEKLGEKYGDKAVVRALEFYHLENERSLTGTDLAALMTGIVANLTADDIPDFKSLNIESLCATLETMRDIQYTSVQPVKKMPYCRQLQHDQMVLSYIKEVDDYRATTSNKLPARSLKHFSHSEYLSRQISYALFNHSKVRFAEGLLFPIYDKKDRLCLVQAHELVSHEGLHGALIKPAKPMGKRDKYQIVFRGTYCTKSLMRDFSPSERQFTSFFDGPGRRSFEKFRDQIIDRIYGHIDGVNQPKLVFDGHSLGAADAMRTMELLMHCEAEKGMKSIYAFNLFAYNTPSLEPDITYRFIESAHALGVPIRLRYFDVHHDPVQQVGSHRLGYYRINQNRPTNVKISIFKFNRNFEERVRALARNFFRRSKFVLSKALEAHTFYCLKGKDTKNPEELNTTFIQDIFTNNVKDVGIKYGIECTEISALSTEDQIEDELVTPFCFVGRKINRFAQRVEKVFTFGRSKKTAGSKYTRHPVENGLVT